MARDENARRVACSISSISTVLEGTVVESSFPWCVGARSRGAASSFLSLTLSRACVLVLVSLV